ncbi:MAG: MATE family efflux transporter [Bacteroidales bacterium]|nr:MATE family efflux transporter [Candidatus Colimorpha onthohippi]
MNRQILRLAVPNIITNITVPLLGMVDMAIVGHLSAAHIGAITIGTSLFNLIYWNFGFLRMGTSGFAAQAYGARNLDEAVRVLVRSLTVAMGIAAMLLLLQWPIARLALLIFDASPSILQMALTYFFIRIWAAPATMANYAIKGWFIGMQNSKLPMWISIFLNIVNILASLIFVLVLHWDIAGVALGTVIAQYAGLAVGLFFVVKNYGKLFRNYGRSDSTVPMANSAIAIRQRKPLQHLIHTSLQWTELKRYFKVNADIFLRAICLALVFTFITAASGRISDQVLAMDALLLQFFMLFSYVMDGFAYAGEALTGRYIGARNMVRLRKMVQMLMVWGIALTVFFTVLYASFGEPFLRLFCNDAAVISGARHYQFWTLVVPACGFAAFLFDGIFAGATASRAIRNSMFIATSAFFVVFFSLEALATHGWLGFVVTDECRNNCLWFSFMVYLSLRGLLQALLLKRSVYAKIA